MHLDTIQAVNIMGTLGWIGLLLPLTWILVGLSKLKLGG